MLPVLPEPKLGPPRPTVQPVRVAWDQSPSTNVTGYSVYYGTAPRTYTSTQYVAGLTTTNAVLTNTIADATNYIAATAWEGALESVYSAEIQHVPKLPTNVVVTVTMPLETSRDMAHWTVASNYTFTLTNPGPSGFFRAGQLTISRTNY